MAVQAVPTKGNLMNSKKSLALAKNGYELLDRKRTSSSPRLTARMRKRISPSRPPISPTAFARISQTPCLLRTDFILTPEA